jgi:hypothetical protein
VTAILWAGVPGQESGNSITDILYSKINPAARTPFTWAPTRESYGTDLLYTPNNGNDAPQDDFTEGNMIDYRAFDKQNITPIYKFGFGLSYTTFEYSELKVTKLNVSAYTPTTGTTEAAPVLGNYSTNLSDYLFPSSSFPRIFQYIYPYLNSTDAKAASADTFYGRLLPSSCLLMPLMDPLGLQVEILGFTMFSIPLQPPSKIPANSTVEKFLDFTSRLEDLTIPTWYCEALNV